MLSNTSSQIELKTEAPFGPKNYIYTYSYFGWIYLKFDKCFNILMSVVYIRYIMKCCYLQLNVTVCLFAFIIAIFDFVSIFSQFNDPISEI